MNDFAQGLEVFDFKQKAVVDSRDVAAIVERPHWQLLRSIDTMIEHLSHNKNVVADFFIPALYIDEQGKERPCYYLTRMGCDLVANKMTGEKGTRFTAAYVKTFHAMEQELTRRAVAREIGKPARRSLTDSIRDSGEQQRMKGYAFNSYTNLIYKAVTGKTAGQLRKKRGANKQSNAKDFLTADEMQAVTVWESRVCAMLDAGMQYEEIRAVLLRREKEVPQ